MPVQSEQKLPVLPCACANLRRAARAVTRLYNQELRQDGIEGTQFTILMALNTAGEIPQGKLGEILALDSTTLTRMLRPLAKRGWVKVGAADDRRMRIFSLTAAGREKFRRSQRRWERAQERLRTALGEETMDQLVPLLVRVTLASVKA
ncbi:MAG TPA: MarR family transcriptional regulator [Terriglobia bacterium]|nr:MarR family transcriptional regulator [Terriglobia bacterium]